MPVNPTAALATDFLKKHGPSDVSFVQDDYNGRWRIVSPTGEWKSVSWTRRGFTEAVAIALFQSYEFQTSLTGELAPFNMEDLAAEIREFAADDVVVA